jgi:hypothetical protein
MTTKRGEGRKFQKGKSGNPGGRAKDIGDVRELAKQHTANAIERLVHWLNSENAKASVGAASVLLDRAWGKPVQAVSGPEGGAFQADITIRTLIVDPKHPDA